MTPPVHQREDDDRPHAHERSTDTGIRGWFHRHLPVLAYIILALAIAFSLNGVRSEGIKRRNEIVVATQKVVRDSCERGNDTRELLRGLIIGGDKQLVQYHKEHIITDAQYKAALKANADAAAKLPNVDCSAAVNKVNLSIG